MKRVNTPTWLRRVFRSLVWEIPTHDNDIYLTFDDGPTPGITSQVLALLFEYKAKATFFCLGANIELYPELFEKIKMDGHTIGNHGYCHLSGFSTSLKKYVKNVEKGAEVSGSKLFRPPYGRITPWQVKRLEGKHKIIQWSIMSMDFDARLTPEQCLYNVISHIKPGSIIVFHDMEKAKKNLLTLLPKLLTWLRENEYETRILHAGILPAASSF